MKRSCINVSCKLQGLGNHSNVLSLKASASQFHATHFFIKKKHNEDIRTELKIFNVKDRINDTRTNWLEHIERMPKNRLPQILLEYQPRGKRRVGRPITRWIDSIS
ncbi:hypothetical protein C0J52_05016 [Blattella germanica]|nr:hypothetical protein C0J52_05016 [Blattella germanica]